MPVQMELDIRSLDLVLKSIDDLEDEMAKAERMAIRAAGKVFTNAARESLSYSERSLDQLAELDHPYAERHGEIKVSSDTRGGAIRDGRHAVHERSGRLLRGLLGHTVVDPKSKAGEAWRVRVHRGSVPYWEMITAGTKNMLPRDPLWETANGPATLRDMQVMIDRELINGLDI